MWEVYPGHMTMDMMSMVDFRAFYFFCNVVRRPAFLMTWN